MYISEIRIRNFRKLKDCKIDINQDKTLFVGANNGGKTTAMDALQIFLPYKDEQKIKIKAIDFTLSNWKELKEIGSDWCKSPDEILNEFDLFTSTVDDFDRIVSLSPSLDLWIKVFDDEVYRVAHLLPSLSWNSENLLGVRFQLEPEINKLKEDYIKAREELNKVKDKHECKELFPKDFYDFVNKNIDKYFKIKSYILDASNVDAKTSELILCDNPLKGIVEVNIIGAQRDLSDVKDVTSSSGQVLSSQLRNYYSKVLENKDVLQLENIETAKTAEQVKKNFDDRLKEVFNERFKEIQNLGYPSFTDPKLKIKSSLSIMDGLKHNAAVQYEVIKGSNETLPEGYNGLGYQNLVSMALKLMQYRDKWINIGSENIEEIEPIHLVIVEEPEAHLHVQVQQIFIEKAYGILTNKDVLTDDYKGLNTQMIVSTHSSSIAHSIDFSAIRYFKRVWGELENLPVSEVKNLKEVFAGEVNKNKNIKGPKEIKSKSDKEMTAEFVSRYIKATHCDLFFADGVIMVEGAVERMLLPHFIRNKFPELSGKYISIIEIGGSHAYRFRKLIEILDVPTLIITDLDSVDDSGKVKPELGKNYKTSNSTLKEWLPKKINLDDLFSEDVELERENLRVSFQHPVDNAVIPYTFEDALVLENIEFFKMIKPSREDLKKIFEIVNSNDDVDGKLYKLVTDKNFKKSELAADILYEDIDEMKCPQYISDGLNWLIEKLNGDNHFVTLDDKTTKGAA